MDNLQVKIGHEHEVIGILRLKDGKIQASGDVKSLQHLINSLKKPEENPSDFLQSLPNRLRGYVWAQFC